MKSPFLDFKKQPKKTLIIVLGLFLFTFLLLNPIEVLQLKWSDLSKQIQTNSWPSPKNEKTSLMDQARLNDSSNNYVTDNDARNGSNAKLKSKNLTNTELIDEALKQISSHNPLPPNLTTNLLYPHVHHFTQGRSPEIFVNFDIKLQGFLVPGAFVRTMFILDESNTPRLAFTDHDWSHLPPPDLFSIRISEAYAIALAQKWENQASPVWRLTKEWRPTENKWAPSWKIRLRGSLYTYFVDVRDGKISREQSVQGVDDHPSRPIQFVGIANKLLGGPSELEIFPLPYLKVETASTSFLVSDEKGVLDTSLPLETLALNLKNSMVEIRDQKNEGIQFALSDSSGVNRVLFNPDSNPHQTAMLNVYFAVTSAYQFLFNKMNLTKLTNQEPVEAWVNIDYQDCNAKYRNGIIAFYDESELCRNTGYDTVVYHEYAHFIDDLFGGITNSALSEGLGDLLATYLSEQPLIGQKLYKKDLSALRSAANNIRFQRESKNQAASELTYSNAQAFSGFAWDVRQSLMDKYGAEDGNQRAANLFFPLFVTNPPHILSAVKEVIARIGNEVSKSSQSDTPAIEKLAKNHGLL